MLPVDRRHARGTTRRKAAVARRPAANDSRAEGCEAAAALRRAVASSEQAQGGVGWPGYCAETGGPTGCIDGVKGWWEVPTVGACLELCAECARCHWVSFSGKHKDCSWYSQCKVAALKTTLSRSHVTYRVREARGLVDVWQLARTLSQAADSTARFADGLVRLNCIDDWFERPTRVFLHDFGWLHQWSHATTPNFRAKLSHAPSTLREWVQAHRRTPNASTLAAGWGKCAVVGSSPGIVRHRAGEQIDAHDAVIRVNNARLSSGGRDFRPHVGSRTTVRVWGSLPLPAQGSFADELVVIYCPPVDWVSECWTTIGSTPHWPRLSPLAWRQVSDSIHGSASTRQFPSSGVMAVWMALTLCSHVTLYGFGGCAGESATRLDAYYTSGDPNRQAQYDFHDMAAEWAWMRELARIGAIKWNPAC